MENGRFFEAAREDLKQIDLELDQNLTSSVPLIAQVGRYILQSGGKRLRPLLFVLSARLCDYQGKGAHGFSIIFEYLHAATLLHDDVVDNADIRRGATSANAVWGNSASVLVGDFLLAKSFWLATAHHDQRMLALLSDITTEMAEGEVLELVQSDNLDLTQEEYLEVVRRKTAVLIAGACHLGAVMAGAPQPQEQALRDFGTSLGMAFQLIDDNLDYEATIEELGKPVGGDLREGKVTLPLIHTLARCTPEQKARIKEVMDSAPIEEAAFEEIKGIIGNHDGLEAGRHMAARYINEAKASLVPFADGPVKQLLYDIADYVISRRR
ncbi:MAG: polyprenyl synthetase family protein [Pseudomonadota bacterium]